MAALLKQVTGKLCTCAVSYARFNSILPYNAISFTRNFSISSLRSARKFTEKHEWVSVDGKIGTVGVSDYAQEALGEVVFVQHPEKGQLYAKDDECGVVESVKAVNEIYTPVSGTVVEINELLADEPNAINESCYERGWIYKLELTEPKELDTLMDEPAYDTYVKSIQK